ncbi:riboflavin synthase [Pseudalkalibacillus salsuginis]|uniref:riboflavin synthase n=1 Tax=Pseudalkalibacillus salsuginis TaxID=2910972 RepID=UPI001F021DE5|nr:riboflavin synthase [Pseudalkalibacillus salsuginis]MCF6408290.1 riboflavin synthase [Pseudalkalibacillus salsuginis]
MFTGIIEEIGKIQSVKESAEGYVVRIEARKVLEDVNLGDSISVNGICLTVTSFESSSFSVDVMPETLRHTNLKSLRTGDGVNLERAMAAGGRFGGHFVSGHIDGVGEIVRKTRKQNAIYYEIKAPKELQLYFMNKGSVAVDGTSLTIFGVTDSTFTLSLIPHTVEESVLGSKDEGDHVNIECDMLVKYMDNLIQKRTKETQSSRLTEEFLSEHGF